MGFVHKIAMSGWWFGTFFYFPYIGNNYIFIPTDEVIFFRGVGLNHQPGYVFLKLCADLDF